MIAEIPLPGNASRERNILVHAGGDSIFQLHLAIAPERVSAAMGYTLQYFYLQHVVHFDEAQLDNLFCANGFRKLESGRRVRDENCFVTPALWGVYVVDKERTPSTSLLRQAGQDDAIVIGSLVHAHPMAEYLRAEIGFRGETVTFSRDARCQHR